LGLVVVAVIIRSATISIALHFRTVESKGVDIPKAVMTKWTKRRRPVAREVVPLNKQGFCGASKEGAGDVRGAIPSAAYNQKSLAWFLLTQSSVLP
jgi:hypothetical protein